MLVVPTLDAGGDWVSNLRGATDMGSVTMRGIKFAVVPVVMLSMVMATLVTWAGSAGASEPPPVVVRNPRPAVHIALGGSFTFKASATDAATVVWVVRSPDGSSFSTFSGDNTLTKKGVLKSSFTFGPVNASENGSEVAATFVNDPTGVPSGIQETPSSFGVVTLKKAPKG
jgi:hypothetical protein